MTTITLLALGGLALIAIANLFLWLLEFMATFIKCIIDYFRGKKTTWSQNYFQIKLFFTSILLKISFAELTPHQLWVHKQNVQEAYNHHLEKKDLKKLKHHHMKILK